MEKQAFYWHFRWVESGIPFSLRGLIDARSEAEILALYPELEISSDVPATIDYEQLSRRFHYDIDEPPSGALLDFVSVRDRR